MSWGKHVSIVSPFDLNTIMKTRQIEWDIISLTFFLKSVILIPFKSLLWAPSPQLAQWRLLPGRYQKWLWSSSE